MRKKCYRCFRPESSCLCPYIKEADPKVKFVILMHPKETRKQKTGTGRLTKLAIKDSQIIVGVDFTQNEKLNALLEDPSYQPFLLYPDTDAYTAHTAGEFIGDRTPLIVVVDATWPLAAKMIKLSRNLHRLPKLSFEGSYRSDYTFKREPAEECVSTIESCYYLIHEMQKAKIAAPCDVESMMDAFHRLVEIQITKEKRRKEIEGEGPQHPESRTRRNKL